MENKTIVPFMLIKKENKTMRKQINFKPTNTNKIQRKKLVSGFMITKEMESLLKKIADLCEKAANEVYEERDTLAILNTCDDLAAQINQYFLE